jgi:serine protease SohB
VSEFLAAYGLFLAQLATFVLLVIVVVVVIMASRRRGHAEGLVVEHLNRRFEDAADELKLAIEGKGRYKKVVKARHKERKREDKARAKDESGRPRVFVLDFKGDLRASAAASLREEVSAILRVAKAGEQVLLRLENSGGTVHEHGFAASQLTRLKQHGLKLAVAVDKVAASGGYLMACVADRLVAAPFAIVGSIGVLAQLPNFHRLLEEKGVDFEQITAGRYKRTLTMFGKNTDEGREKLQQEVEDIHELFKNQIREHRPQVDLERVATGDGIRALELKLVDELKTSDDLLLEVALDHDLYHIAYKRRRSWQERVLGGAEGLLTR